MKPSVVVVGAGFAGLEAVRALAHADVAITLIDRKKHHCFQRLLYQVATLRSRRRHRRSRQRGKGGSRSCYRGSGGQLSAVTRWIEAATVSRAAPPGSQAPVAPAQ